MPWTWKTIFGLSVQSEHQCKPHSEMLQLHSSNIWFQSFNKDIYCSWMSVRSSAVIQSNERLEGIIYSMCSSSPVGFRVCWFVCGEVTNKSQTCLPHGKMCVCMLLAVCPMVLQRHMVDTFKIFYKCYSRHCKIKVKFYTACQSQFTAGLQDLYLELMYMI